MSAYQNGDERNCRYCQQPIYFGGLHWWHKHNESTYCVKTVGGMDIAEPDLDEVERVRVAGPDLLEALKAAQFSPHGYCSVCAGWNVGPYGDTSYAHTATCIVALALAKATGGAL